MTGRLWRGESGMALGLAVVLIVLIGVLAAGLLAVLHNDLEGAIQANRGQRAFLVADAGAQAATTRLRADATPEHYDANGAENSGWAQVPPEGDAPGVSLTLGEDAATATIQYLLPATTDDETRDELHAPERVPAGLTDYPDRDYFLVVSEGSSGEARRKVEVILLARRSDAAGEIVQWSWREVYE